MRWARRHPVVTVSLAVALGVLATILATAAAVWKAAHTDDARRVDHADLIAILGAAQYNGTPSPVFRGRLEQGELLFKEGFAGRILVLGGKEPGDRTTEGEAGRSWLVEHGVPSEAVVADPVGNTTLESLESAARFMERNRLRSVFLVSDPWHNLRIRRIGHDLGMQAYVSATWHSAARGQWTRLSGYTRETFAYLGYRLSHP